MANKTLFQTTAEQLPRATDTVNGASAPAYAFEPRHVLAQYAATGCLNGTFYSTAEMQLDEIVRACDRVPATFIAKTALYSRERGFMKDMPALLCALLSVQDAALFERIFDRVIDDGKMLRNLVQILRSGQVGRKSLGSLPKRMVQWWFASRSDEQIFRASIGNDPSLGDVIKMAHPRPQTASRRALYGYLAGRPYDADALPEIVQRFEAYKRNPGEFASVPNVPFQLLTALPLDSQAWREIACNATWQQTRMNLSAFARHGVFEHRRPRETVIARLRNRQEIEKARVMPYQLMTAYLAASNGVPEKVRDALQDALQIALGNVPAISGKVYVCCDVSGSMSSPLTGHRQGATTTVRCIDVAALFAAAMLRKNDAEVLAFENNVVSLRLNRRDTVMTNARKLASIGGGGTNCSAPLAQLNAHKAYGSLIVYVSDNESWLDAGGRGTAMMREWMEFKARNPEAKLVCIDLQPNKTTQAYDDRSILNVGGFSDAVFDLVAMFAKTGRETRHWVDVIEQVQL